LQNELLNQRYHIDNDDGGLAKGLVDVRFECPH